MKLERPNILFQPCLIKPFDNLEGLILSVRYDRCGCEVYVRYVLHGMLRYNWFYDFDIEMKEEDFNNNFGYNYQNDGITLKDLSTLSLNP